MSFKKLDLCKDKYFFAHLGMRMPFFAVAAFKNKLNIRLFHEYLVTVSEVALPIHSQNLKIHYCHPKCRTKQIHRIFHFSLFTFHLKTHRIFKRSPFGLQNESFWRAKRILLDCKTNPFEEQNESFCKAKVVTWLSRSCRSAQLKLPFGITKRQLILNKIDFQRVTNQRIPPCAKFRPASIRRKINSKMVNPHSDDPP